MIVNVTIAVDVQPEVSRGRNNALGTITFPGCRQNIAIYMKPQEIREAELAMAWEIENTTLERAAQIRSRRT